MNDEKIETLGHWDMPDTVQKQVGWEVKTLPEATTANMTILMNKINELVETVNYLKSLQ